MIFSRRNPIDEPSGERRCPGCGNGLAPDQLACLDCGSVPDPGAGSERRWLLRTGGVAGGALLLVTSASFAATTALRSGDPHGVKPAQPPAVAQVTPAVPPASQQKAESRKQSKKQKQKQKQASVPAPPAAAPTPAPAPAPSGGGSGGSSGGGNSGSNGGNSGTGSGDPGTGTAAAKLTKWADSEQGSYTVIVYKFADKADATREARGIARKDLPAGVVQSDDYESLAPGSYLVFVGQFDSAQEASDEQAKYDRAGYPGDVTFVGHQQSPDYSSGASATPQAPSQPTTP